MFRDLQDSMHVLCLKIMGLSVEYARGALVVPVTGVFDANYVEVDPSTGAPVMSVGPLLGVRTADLPDGKAMKGDRITVDGVVYRVIEARPDSEGGIDLILEAVRR